MGAEDEDKDDKAEKEPEKEQIRGGETIPLKYSANYPQPLMSYEHIRMGGFLIYLIGKL